MAAGGRTLPNDEWQSHTSAAACLLMSGDIGKGDVRYFALSGSCDLKNEVINASTNCSMRNTKPWPVKASLLPHYFLCLLWPLQDRLTVEYQSTKRFRRYLHLC